MRYQLIPGDNSATLKSFPDNHFDSIVTDPPYGINFLGKTWDATIGSLETYQECLRVLKPGGHILAFSSARTYHHLAITIEQAGFEIRDQIMWIYSSGFPKSQDVGRSIQRSLGVKEKTTVKGGARPSDKQTGGRAKAWTGWGTQLKPAHEPIVLARKPIKTSIAQNCQTWGVGAINIDATRVPYEEDDTLEEWKQRYPDVAHGTATTHANYNPELLAPIKKKKSDKEKIMDWANKYSSPGMKEYAKLDGSTVREHTEDQYKPTASPIGRFPSNVVGEIVDYQKYFYCPKVGRRERHVGFDTVAIPQMGSTHPDDVKKHPLWDPSIGGDAARLKKKIDEAGQYLGNNHPTVKPVELMKYLIRLVTPTGGHVLDPFTGSGSTGMAAVELDYEFTGCELDPAYIDIAHKRIQAWYQDTHPNMFSKLFIND